MPTETGAELHDQPRLGKVQRQRTEESHDARTARRRHGLDGRPTRGLSGAPAALKTLNGYVVKDARQPGGDQAHHVQENDDAGMLAH